jgi:hypothetical protein
MNLDDLPRKKHSACDAVAELKKLDFNREWRAALGKVQAYRDLKFTLTKLRDELKSETNWKVGELRQVTAGVLQTAKLSGDLVTNLSGLGGGKCVLEEAGKETAVALGGTLGEQIAGQTGSDVYYAAKSGKSVRRPVIRGLLKLGETVVKEALKCFGKSIGTAIAAITDFAETTREMTKSQLEFNEVRKEAAEQIGKLDEQIHAADAKLGAAENWMTLKGDAIAGAQRACDEDSGSQVSVSPLR